MSAGQDILYNFNVFIDGVGQFGRCKSFEPPKLKTKREEYRGAGMDIPIEVDLGMEKLEATLTMQAMSPEYWRAFGLGPGKIVPFTFRGAIANELDGTKTSVIIHTRGKIAEIDEGTIETAKLIEVKLSLSLVYYKRIHDKTTIVEIDAGTGTRVIGDTDTTAWIRDAIALN